MSTAAILAIGVAASAVNQNDLGLGGRALLVYAGVAYGAVALELWWLGVLAALLATTAAVLLILGGLASAPHWYPLVMAAIAALIYGTHSGWDEWI
jgi:hypothetical protein